jgi:phosphoribosylamine---glycine ligase
MITDKGPELIEYNVRFGDPECQVLMMRMKSDLLPLLLAAAKCELDRAHVEWRDETALTVVMASKGYPGSYDKGTPIEALPENATDLHVFHAGTALKDGRLVATGGRVLNVTALGDGVSEAQSKAYRAIDDLRWDNGFCRRDIGWRAVAREKN